ncbi:glycoside hydrolase family 30 protein [Hyaloscypha variabilis]|jgi:O-glycosyl hydrolase
MSISASLTAIWLVATSQLFDVASSSFLSKRTQPSVSIVVDTSIKYQELDGFGCSQAFQRAEDIFGKYGLDAENTQYVLDLLFDVNIGAGLSILRNGIGSSNSSASNFMNSIEPFSPGSPNGRPNYTWNHYDSGQFPLAQQAQARGLSTLYGDAWSAPGYMKTNDDENNGGYLCGVTNEPCASGDWKQAYANYLVQWARFYEESGVKVTNIGFLNEPQFAATYAGMLSNGTQAADFIRVLAKTIQASGLDLKINCCDGIGWDDQEAMMPGLLAGPDPAINYLSVVTGHGYDSPPNYTLTTNGVKTWLSEWGDLTGDYHPYTFYEDGGPAEGMTWAKNIQVALVDANVSGFLYWIGAENSTSSSSLINLINNSIVTTKRFWTFAQFSKFARPGAYRVKATSSDSLITVSSFLNTGGGVATQVINSGSTAYTVELKVSGFGGNSWVQPYLTDNANNLTALAKVGGSQDGTFTTEIPAWSLVSFVLS